jgi:hypothetical protein
VKLAKTAAKTGLSTDRPERTWFPRRRQVGRTRQAGPGTWLLAASLLAGCSAQEIHSTYGKRRGAEGEASVNGTAVLTRMFELTGHKTQTRSYLSPSAKDFDVIVWFPDEFKPPAEEPQKFLEDWLYRGQGKTLIYVGRDYDATIDYWEKVLPTAPPEQSVEVLRRLAQARAEHARTRSVTPEAKDCRWFDVRRDEPRRYVGRRQEKPAALRGPWAADVRLKPAELDLVVDARLAPLKHPPHDDFGGRLSPEIWLSVGNVPLVWRITNTYWSGGQIVVVNNGSFLLNLPLVEREHRKLAARLIAACGSAPKKVMFLESGVSGVTVFEEEPGTNYPTGFEAFTAWPLGAILVHFVVLGLTILACRWTVFGRPRELPRPPVSDFGHHVEALGELLARTQDQAYAQHRLAEYRRKTAAD